MKNQVKKLNTEKSPYNVEHQYNTISIFGGRGTGKTTFILSLLQSIEEEYKNDAEILKIIDPTQMEEKEHVFLVILSLIDTEVRRKIESHRKDNNASCCCFEKEWRNKLSSLAKGLPTLEGLNKKQYENWDDDLYIVERGLNNVKSAYDLESNFHELVDIALDILGKKFFVLAFDDIDVNMSKGWSVLETIRKYLTTPKFVIFLSGNLTLYSYNVRLHQWNQLKELKTFEEHDYKSQVNQLEGQYLLKVLKPENRIQLRTLLDYKHIYQTSYMIKEEAKEIVEVYSTILNNFGIHKNSTQQLFIDYLLGLSIRSQISILSDYNEPDIMSQINAYVSRMMVADIDVDLAIKNPIFTIISIVEYLKKSNGFPHSYLLIPNTINHDMNGVLMGLTTIFANQVKQSPWIIFDYMLRVGYTRNLNLQLSPTAFDQILSYTGITQDMSIKNIVLLMTAVGKANNLKLPELILLEGLALKAKKNKKEKKNAIDIILKGDNISMTPKVLALLPLFSLGKGQHQKTELYYSVLPLLSTICMIIRLGKDASSIKGLLSDLSLHRTYPMPSEGQIISDTAEENISSNEELSEKLDINIEDESVKRLVKALIAWRESFIHDNENSPIPPYLLGRIMTRFTSALINVPNKENLAELFQQHLIVFLNSVLIEEAKEIFGNNLNINNNNPVGSPQLFYDNLGKVTSKNEDGKSYFDSLSLVRCLLSCPLISFFFSTKVSLEINKHVNDIIINDMNLFNTLSKANFETKENDVNGKIDITKKNIKESLKRIIDEKGVEFFRTNIYDIEDNRKAYKVLKNLPFVNSIAQDCARRLNNRFKRKYIDKQ
ncbi:crinivirus P26 protein [Prevotella melaninogenica]|nr:crinivirus P26 protein [Prevotella melaninogenica]